MATSLQQAALVKPGDPSCELDRRQHVLTEEACLTGMAVLGGVFCLIALLLILRLLYWVLVWQEAIMVPPTFGAS